jgi:hypothetical protein
MNGKDDDVDLPAWRTDVPTRIAEPPVIDELLPPEFTVMLSQRGLYLMAAAAPSFDAPGRDCGTPQSSVVSANSVLEPV